MIKIFNKRIAVDICNTLADVNRELEKRFGPVPDPNMYFHPSVKDIPNFFSDNLDVFLNAEPIKNSIYELNILARFNHVVYITARPKTAYFVTKRWLQVNGYPLCPIIFTRDKVKAAKKFGIEIAIDDSPYDIEEYLKSGIKVYIKKQSYNKAYPNRFEWGDNTFLKAGIKI